METTNTNHTPKEGSKVTEKIFNDSGSTMVEFYNKQLNLVTGFYSNLLKSFVDNPSALNESSFPNPFLQPSGNMYKQMFEFNRNLLSAFTNQINNNEIDMEGINKNYQETIGSRIEASRKIFKSLSEACSNKMDFSIETNKKLMEEISSQFNLVIKQNQKFWADVLGTYQPPVKGEEKKSKEANPIENKKRSSTPVNEFMDHKV
jgi:hypothetical protein